MEFLSIQLKHGKVKLIILKKYNIQAEYIRKAKIKNVKLADSNNRKFKDKMDNTGIINQLKLDNNELSLGDLLFNDFGVENYKNRNYNSYKILTEVTSDGTRVFSDVNEEGFYYLNQELTKDLNFGVFVFFLK